MLEFCSHTTQWSCFRATYRDLGSPTDALKSAKLKPTNNKTVYFFINISSAITVVGLICQFPTFERVLMHAIAYICSNVVLKKLTTSLPTPVKYINISVYCRVSNVQTVQLKLFHFPKNNLGFAVCCGILSF